MTHKYLEGLWEHESSYMMPVKHKQMLLFKSVWLCIVAIAALIL